MYYQGKGLGVTSGCEDGANLLYFDHMWKIMNFIYMCINLSKFVSAALIVTLCMIR